MNKNKKKILILIEIIAVVILTLLIFSNHLRALNINDVTSANTTAELAYIISENPNALMDASIEEILSIDDNNNLAVNDYYVDINGDGVKEKTADIYYKSALCLYHNQSSVSGAAYKIANIVDIETPGIVTVYDEKGNKSVVNVAESEEQARKIFTEKFRKKSGEFDFLTMKKSISGFARLIYLNTINGEYYTATIPGNPFIEDQIGNWMYQYTDVGSYQIREYIWASGLMNEATYNGEVDNKGNQQYIWGQWPNGLEYRNEVKESVAELCEGEPSITKNNTIPQITYQDGKAYIGPLQATFQGGRPNLSVEGKTAQWATKGTNGTFTLQTGNILTSGQVFYAVIDENVVKNLSNVNLKLQIRWTKYVARLVTTNNPVAKGQNLMFSAGKQKTDSLKIDWKIEQSKTISIQKQDANGNNLKVAGIKFEVYSSDGRLVGTLTTDVNGKTNAIKVSANKEYTIKEIANTAYGYKGCVITEAKLASGAGNVTLSNGQVKVNVTADSIISIKNQPQLTNLTIHKTGENNKNLEGVQFVLWKGDAYLKLDEASVTTPIVTSDAGLDITKYSVTTVATPEAATKFATNASGKIVINNLEVYAAKDIKYNYWLKEISNKNYGYKGMGIATNDVTVTGGTKLEVKPSSNEIKFDLNGNTTVKIANSKQLGNIEIVKVGEDGKYLPNVQFIIQRDTNEYIQLKDYDGKQPVSLLEYTINYVADKNQATKFVTNEQGKIVIRDFEVNKSASSLYSYTAHEIYNHNYGYGSTSNTSLKQKVTLKVNETVQIKLTNTQELGNIELTKYGVVGEDETNKIVLPNVGFVIQVSPSAGANYGYIALYDKNGTIVNNAPSGSVNTKNYEVRYYESSKQYSQLLNTEKSQITTFTTGSDGKLTVDNLEVYLRATGNKYTYKLIEVSNENYGYSANAELGNIQLTAGTTNKVSIDNKQVYTKISGYVWEEKSDSKSNLYDKVYTNSDLKLTDLYKIENGKLMKNSNAKVSVEIKLRNKTTGEVVKTQPDEFDSEGKYTFNNVEIAKLENYEVVFEYNGFKYTTTKTNLNLDNGSKVKEVQEQRAELNDKFGEVKDANEVVTVDGTKNTVEYNKSEHTSTVSKLNFDTTIKATTSEANMNLNNEFNKNSNKEIQNINMGIVLREQPKVAIGSDIHSVSVEVNEYDYTYYYNGRHNHYTNLNGDEVGVKFEQESSLNRYTRTVYSSDVEALEKNNATMNVSLIYKITLINQATTLTSIVNEIENYFDGDYTIKAIGSSLDANNNIVNQYNYTNGQIIEGLHLNGVKDDSNKTYNSTKIKLGNDGIVLKAGENQSLYIEFSISQEAIKGLLNGTSTYHNATEITSYSTFYGDATGKDSNNEYFTTEQRTAGEIYAGIDRASQPGNIELELIQDSREQGKTLILNTANFEDDTTSAPAFLLEATETRKISGTVWEDASVTDGETREKLGNGIFDENEKLVQNVKVELYTTDGNIAKYSNGKPVSTITDANGKYTLGYYDEANKEYVGILPGKYTIKYTYNNESYIINNQNINPNDYKSTIITSNVIKNAFDGENKNEKWYIVQEENRYSDARDDINLRPEYTNAVESITNSTCEIVVVDSMEANTPIMDIGIEFTQTDELADANTVVLITELQNVDFGIAERPNVHLELDKQITSLEIVAQNGAAIIPKGDPTDINSRMQYVKKLDGLVSAEMEAKLLQGATLNIEYTITVKNNSDKDYLESQYYYYGTGGKTENVARAKKVVDYLDNTMSLDSNIDQSIWTVTTADALYNDGNGFISKEVYNELKKGNYHILVTEAFEEVGVGSEKSEKIYATRALAVSDSIREENRIEIIELTGKRTIKQSIPGNYVPSESPQEADEEQVSLVITPPTGTTVNYTIYIVAGIATFVILVLGIVIIKKKIIK